MAGTNGFNPAGFYGVAFDHLANELTLGAVEAADIFAATALTGIAGTFAVTEPIDVLAVSASIIATADFAVTEGFDVLVATVTSVTHASLSVTEDFTDTFVGNVAAAHMFDLALVELADVVAMELATTAVLDLNATETALDTFAGAIGIVGGMDLVAEEDADTFAGVVGRWEFFYDDTEAIRVPWEKQKVAVQGPPKGVVNRRHEIISAFYFDGFYPVAFFTGSGQFDYDDNSAIRVPPASVMAERLRESRGSRVEPRARR